MNDGIQRLDNLSFRLASAESIAGKAREWSMPLRFLHTHMLLFVARGQGWLTIDGRYVELCSRTVYILKPGQLAEASVPASEEPELYVLHVDVLAASGSDSERRPSFEAGPFPLERESLTVSPVSTAILCEQICRQWHSAEPLMRFRAQIGLHELVHALLMTELGEGDGHHDVEHALEETRQYIEAHYRDELAIGQLAGIARLSPRHFMRLFKKRYGCSTIEYLAAYRIKQAQLLMQLGKAYRVRDIAKHVGYHDDLYFRRKFKQISGAAPAAFMKMCRQSIVAWHGPVIGILLALQIIPRGAPADHPWTDYYRRKYDTARIVPLSPLPEQRLEQLHAAVPDYIVGIDEPSVAERRAEIGTLAPVLLLPEEAGDWRAHLRQTAHFLGRDDIAEAWLKRYERKASSVRQQLGTRQRKQTLLLLRIEGRRLIMPGRRSTATVFYDDLLFVPVGEAGIDGKERDIAAAELERLHADRLLLFVAEDAASKASHEALADSEYWRRFPAIRSGFVEVLPAYPWTDYCAFVHDLMLDKALKLWHNRA